MWNLPAFLPWAMTQDELASVKKECADCHTVAAGEARLCAACGGKNFTGRAHSRFASDAIAAFIGVIAVILFWLVRS